MTRPRVTDPAALLLFVTEPQQLDAVFEYGTERLSPASIRTAPAMPTACSSCEERAALDGGELCRRCAIADGAEGCDWCDGIVGGCADDCGCPPCEVSRALDEDAAAWADR
jgi:hypothetical protein